LKYTDKNLFDFGLFWIAAAHLLFFVATMLLIFLPINTFDTSNKLFLLFSVDNIMAFWVLYMVILPLTVISISEYIFANRPK
jgi:hypothetical protein